MRNFDAQLAAVASRQHWLISARDINAAGGSRWAAQRRVAAHIWEDCGDNVWRFAGHPWTYEARVLEAILRAGDGACASHLCAARLRGFGFATASIEISVPRARFHRPKGVIVHTSTDLDRCEIETLNGIPTTDPARTLLDCARRIKHPRTLGRTIERARRTDTVDWGDIAKCLAAHARRGRPGIRRLRLALAAGAASDEITESDAEYIALCLLREHGLPEPTVQHEVRHDDGELSASMDFAYLEQLTNFEIDGPHHLEPEQRAKDDDRDYWLRQRGWTVRRIPHRMPVDEPTRFLRVIRQTLRDNGHPSFVQRMGA